MKYSYFPGCTLHEQSKSFNQSTLASSSALGIELEELKDWYCCGAVFPLRADDIMSLLSPVRTLIGAKKEGKDLVTLCAACYQVLKRTNYLILEDREKREKINNYLEEDYKGDVKVLHLLEVLRDNLGWLGLREKVSHPLSGLKVAPYYGCLLLRPAKEMTFDHPENPTIFEDFLKSLGCDVPDFPYKTECCGAYLGATAKDVVSQTVYNILHGAQKRKIGALIVSCPLCHYNLDFYQGELMKEKSELTPIPIFYFTQLLALALGLSTEVCHFEEHRIDPLPFLGVIK